MAPRRARRDHPRAERPIVVFVHSPLVGPLTWRRVAARVARAGWEVVVPELPLGAAGDDGWWPAQVDAVVGSVGRLPGIVPVVLVGHSGAGPLLPAIGERFRPGVHSYVFVDAALPHPGVSRSGALPEALAAQLRSMGDASTLPPWHEWFAPGAVRALVPDARLRDQFVAELRPVPRGLLEEPLPDVAGWPDAPRRYLRLSDAYEPDTAAARAAGWHVVELPAHHLAPLTDASVVASAILGVLDLPRA